MRMISAKQLYDTTNEYYTITMPQLRRNHYDRKNLLRGMQK